MKRFISGDTQEKIVEVLDIKKATAAYYHDKYLKKIDEWGVHCEKKEKE